MTPPVFVVDTSVVAAGLVTAPTGRTSPVTAVLDAMLSGSIVYLMSPDLLYEYRSVLLRPKLTRLHGLHPVEVDGVLEELAANAVWREPATHSPAPDRGDDHLWALLASYAGSTLITGDHLLLQSPPTGHSVIAPRTWLDRRRSH
ncbi:MAG: PIN domain-containing protein [Gammaproteobacteria bacterium]|nr:MAG: PIN domain-containing protein [Gammaproteobacteria bacterium]